MKKLFKDMSKEQKKDGVIMVAMLLGGIVFGYWFMLKLGGVI